MSESNGTATQETETEVETTNRLTKGKGNGGKSKTKPSRFAQLWDSARENGEKGSLKGVISTEEGDLKVSIKSFPASVTDEEVKASAVSDGMDVNFPLGMRKAAGVKLKNGTMKFEGVGAQTWLEKVEETDEQDSEE